MTSTGPLHNDLAKARFRTDSMFALINANVMYERPIPERHRLIFYLGHLEAFDWNQICRGALGMPSFHQSFDQLFEAGIDPSEGDLPTDQPYDWPAIDEVQKYNARVRHEVDQILDSAPDWAVHVAIEHRLMHAETNAYLFHHLENKHKSGPSSSLRLSGRVPAEEMVTIPDGMTTLGRHPEEGFGWDNEFSRHEVHVPAFLISRYKVSNQQYLQFVREGGEPPAFWVQRKEGWCLRTMFHEVPLPLSWPVYVTHRQAQAYANWRGLSLPTEAQFHRAAFGTPNEVDKRFPWGERYPESQHGNFDFQSWDPVPVTDHSDGRSGFGVDQMIGNGWEWTSTIFHPFKGFSPLSTYPGYSSRFFDQDHYVVKGGGPYTANRLLRRSFRNWFRQGYPYAHIGFRCVRHT